MPQERLLMRKIREVLRLSAQGLSKRRIAASLGISATAAAECLHRARRAGVSWPLPDDVDDAVLQLRLYPPATLSNTAGGLVHGDPSLSKRARGAAPATVRVRWKGGRGARLTDGLRRPGGGRTPARHRDPQSIRVAEIQVTRGNGQDPTPPWAIGANVAPALAFPFTRAPSSCDIRGNTQSAFRPGKGLIVT